MSIAGVYRLESEQAMHELAAAVGQVCQSGLITLSGDLGVGKTTFVRGLLVSLGYQGIVKSPSYGLLESYDVQDLCVVHGDLYRLNDIMELEAIGFRDYFDDGALILLEWPEKAFHYLPVPCLEISITAKDEARLVHIKKGALK